MQNSHKKHKHHSYQARHHQGPVKRVTRALADKFGIARKFVLLGFIIGCFVNFLLTVIVFLLSLYWVNNSEKVERKFYKFANKVRAWTTGTHSGPRQRQYAYAGPQADNSPPIHEQEVSLDFSDLCREFEDLERRTAGMEKHVSSVEYNLDKEFKKMKRDDS